MKLKATISPKGIKGVSWKSNKKAVAKVNGKGVVKAVKNGSATITATVKGSKKKATCKITVGTPVNAVSVETPAVTLKVGETSVIKTNVLPKTASNKKVSYMSSNEAVAKVEANGTITAVAEGTAVVTVKAKDGSKKKATVTVTVQAASTPVAPAPTTPVTPEPVAPVAVTGVNISKTEASMDINTNIALVASVVPNNAANKNIAWKTSDQTIATVDSNGNVKALKEGNATITAVSEDGSKEANCKVTVEPNAVATNKKELETYLKQDSLNKVIYNTQEVGAIEIEEGDYPDLQLVVNAPAATITNSATFKNIQIKQLSENTWVEKASGNQIDLYAGKAHVIVKKDAQLKLSLKDGVKEATIENDGTIDDIQIDTKAQVKISGDNKSTIPVTTTKKGTFIQTEIQLAVDAQDDFTLKVQPGAENSTIAIPDDSVVPAVVGVGVIPVTNRQKNEVRDVVADNTGELDENAAKGSVTGSIETADKESLQEATVYVIPYQASIETSKIDAAIETAKTDKKCKETTTDEEGKYTITDIPYGNYLQIVKKDGYKNYIAILTINAETFTSEVITLVVPSGERFQLSGTIYDAKLGNVAVPEGITLTLRAGNNTTIGLVEATATTDANGRYQFENIEPGNYTVQVSDNRSDIAESERYIRMNYNVTVQENTTKDMTISQKVTGDQVRFVLTWGSRSANGEVPEDLDSHLLGPTASGNGRFHTYYMNKTYREYEEMDNDGYGVTYADLDYDDTNYEGPETTTVYKDVNGEYHFYIYDFSDQEDSDNTRLATSRAVVKVYRGEQNIATYNVPDGVGTLWDVCTYNIHTNVLTPINKIYYHTGDSTNVGKTAMEIAQERLESSVSRYANLNLGDALKDEIAGRLAKANVLLNSTTAMAEELQEYATELEDYCVSLLSGTAIETITGDLPFKSYFISRQCSSVDSLQSESVLYITMKKQADIYESLNVALSDEDAAISWQESDKEGYSKMLVVTNSRTEAVEKYYVVYKEYEPNLTPSSITDGDNYIVSSYYDSVYDEESEQYVQCYIIYGENPTLSNPIFTFGDEEVTGVYTPVTEDSGNKNYTGTLTITYEDTVKTLPVKYEQRIRRLELSGVTETGNPISYITSDYIYDENDDGYDVHWIEGKNKELGSEAEFRFYGVDMNSYTCSLEKVSDSTIYNYKLVVKYKGDTQTVYIKYTQDTSITDNDTEESTTENAGSEEETSEE